jgi:hypothetical protein
VESDNDDEEAGADEEVVVKPTPKKKGLSRFQMLAGMVDSPGGDDDEDEDRKGSDKEEVGLQN